MDNIFSVLGKLTNPIFKNFTLEELKQILQSATLKVFAPKEDLMHEGDINQLVYIIIDGSIAVTKKGLYPGEIVKLAVLGQQSVVGEISVLFNRPKSATVSAIINTRALELDIEKIATNNQELHAKLLLNLTGEMSKKLIYANSKIEKISSSNVGEVFDEGETYVPTSILLLFGWKWKDILYEIPFIAERGYDAIKIYPPQEAAINTGRPWWEIYQPVSYYLSQFYGNEEDLRVVIDACHSFKIKIYVDLVMNHMAYCEPNVERIGTNEHKFTKYHYGPLNDDNDQYTNDDFYHFTKDGNLSIAQEDYAKYDRIWHIEHFDLLGLPKLNLESPHVVGILRKYLKYLLALGIDGFRIDAGKHMPMHAVSKILSGLRTYDGLKPFIYLEYYCGLPMGIDVHSYMEKYFNVGFVTAFSYGNIISDAINKNNGNLEKLVRYSLGSSWIHYPENKTVVVLDNHDTERDNEQILNYKKMERNAYTLAYIFMLAWPFGIPKIMSSFRFNQKNDPIPTTPIWQNNFNTCFDKNSPWVGQHRWNALSNMVLFRSKTKHATGIGHVWTTEHQIAFARLHQKPKQHIISVGFVVINNTEHTLKQRFETGLPDNNYLDLIHGNINDKSPTAPKIKVENFGFADLEVAPYDAVVICIDFTD